MNAAYVFQLAWAIYVDEVETERARRSEVSIEFELPAWVKEWEENYPEMRANIGALLVAMEAKEPPEEAVRRVETVSRWGEFVGPSANAIAFQFARRVIVTLEDGTTSLIKVGDPAELNDSITAEVEAETEPDRPPEWITRRELLALAVKIASKPPSKKTLQHVPGFTKRAGKKDHVANYQALLPVLRGKWPEIPWPAKVSTWD